MNIWMNRLQTLLLPPHDHNETYKVHKETFSRTGRLKCVLYDLSILRPSKMEGFLFAASSKKEKGMN